MRKFLVFCLAALFVSGCVQITEIADSDPIYRKPSVSLEEKAQLLRGAIDKWCVDEEGLLLWRCYPKRDPQSMDPVLGWLPGDHADSTWQQSYSMADMAAWQGQYITGLAFEWATTGVSTEEKIIAGLNALENSYKATGVPGVQVRSWFKHDGERLPWMKTKEMAIEKNIDQGWWLKGENGFWYRNQTAGGHHQGIWTALCVLGALERDGKINLSMEGRAAALRVIEPLYKRIVANGGKITDADGSVTGYGNMNVYGVNPQYALWHLSRASAALVWGVEGAQEEYDEMAAGYSSVVKTSFRIMMPVLKRLPIHRRVKPNDIHWQHHAWLGLIMVHGVNGNEEMREVRRGFEVLYEIHEPFNIHNWVIQNAGRTDLNDSAADAHARSAFEWYPLNKFVFNGQGRKDTKQWQPIQNRKINTAYAKGKPYQKALVGEHTGAQRSNMYVCGFDYLMIYYAARYFELPLELTMTILVP